MILRQGTVRQDGYRFCGYYQRTRKDGTIVVLEKWRSPAAYEKNLNAARKWRAKNKTKVAAALREWRKQNIEKSRGYTKKWSQANKAKVAAKNKRWAEQNREKRVATSMKYARNNPEKMRQKRKKYYLENTTYFRAYAKSKLAADSNFKLATYLRNRIRSVLVGRRKSAASLELLGCSYEEARKHLERQFTSKMSWKNYGKYWHVDHIKPLALFDLCKASEQRKAFHWTNLQPLRAEENLRKGKRVPAMQKTERPKRHRRLVKSV